jgi:hypothetical protein
LLSEEEIAVYMSNPGISKIEFAADSPLEGTGFELSVPRESLAEDRDDGLLFRSRWRKISVEERRDSAVRVIARERLYTDVVPIVLPVEVSAADIGPAAPPPIFRA